MLSEDKIKSIFCFIDDLLKGISHHGEDDRNDTDDA
jgi:hypothetical protein